MRIPLPLRPLALGLWLPALAMLLGLSTPVHALMQTDMTILGVSTNLDKLGVVESWIGDGSGLFFCEVRLYGKDQWEPLDVKQIQPTESQSAGEKACKTLQQKVTKANELHVVPWKALELTPAPPAIKNEAGQLLTGTLEELAENYPTLQEYTFALSPNDRWQVAINSLVQPEMLETPSGSQHVVYKPVGFDFAFRPEVEPIPFLTFHLPYDEGTALITPIKTLINEQFGLIMVTLREYRQGYEGFDYHYRPLYLSWPTYLPLSAEEARTKLLKAAEYAMEPTEWQKGPNSMHPAYRAYLRMKQEHLPKEEILGALDDASPAGKLYWMALLLHRDPQEYQKVYQEVLRESGHNTDVLEAQGQAWATRPFNQILKEQVRKILYAQ